MGLNKSKGNMYDFITHTWNTIKGKCYHDCSYCYMKRWKNQKPVRFDEKELKEFDRDIKKYGEGLFIFVGSSCDMFANIDLDDIQATLSHCNKFDNKYFFQSKNPFAFQNDWFNFPKESAFCTTIETNRFYDDIMKYSPKPHERAFYMPNNNYVTIEPIMDFDLSKFIVLLKIANPMQINIGADSGNNNLPEPPKEKILELISELEKFTKVKQKSNLKRLLT